VERCSGHAGTYGVKKATHAYAMKIGKPVVKAMATMKDGSKPDFISSDCPLGGHHIAQGMQGKADDKLAHPLTLLRMAYGLTA
jgi:Fe-S oxidoreductase